MKNTRDDGDELVWHIKTEFKGAQKMSQIIIRLAPKSKCEKFYFNIPAKGTPNSKRMAIVFNKGSGEGLNPRFGKFLHDHMKQEVKKWKNLEQMHSWVTQKHVWKRRVRSQWNNKQKRVTRSSRPLVQLVSESPSVMIQPRGKRSICIPVPQVTFNQKYCAAITVYPRPEARDNKGRVRKAQVIVWIPRHIYGTSVKKGKEMTMGFQFGDCKRWLDFIVEYIKYAVHKCKTRTSLRNWAHNQFRSFKELVNMMYKFGGYHLPRAPPRTFRIAKSTIKPDPSIGDIKNSGFGLFCTVRGWHTFTFDCSEPRVAHMVDKRTTLLTRLQKTYQAVGSKTDPQSLIVWVPSKEALKCCAVQCVYLIQHRDVNPTHILDFDEEDNTILRPRREAKPPEEYCFDYGWKHSPCDSPVQKKLQKEQEELFMKEKTASELARKKHTVSEGAAKEKTASEKKDLDEGPFKDPLNNRLYVPKDVNIDAPHGSCFFEAIQDQLSLFRGMLPLLNHRELRKIAVDVQAQGRLLERKSDRQLKYMCKLTTFATEHEMTALCIALGVNIRIRQTRNSNIWINTGLDYQEDRPTLRIMLDFHSINNNKNHFLTLHPLI